MSVKQDAQGEWYADFDGGPRSLPKLDMGAYRVLVWNTFKATGWGGGSMASHSIRRELIRQKVGTDENDYLSAGKVTGALKRLKKRGLVEYVDYVKSWQVAGAHEDMAEAHKRNLADSKQRAEKFKARAEQAIEGFKAAVPVGMEWTVYVQGEQDYNAIRVSLGMTAGDMERLLAWARVGYTESMKGLKAEWAERKKELEQVSWAGDLAKLVDK